MSNISNPVCRIRIKDSLFLVFHICDIICPTGLREIDSFTNPEKLESPSTAEISQMLLRLKSINLVYFAVQELPNFLVFFSGLTHWKC